MIVPNYINIYIKNNSIAVRRIKQVAEKLWLNFEIKFLFSKKQSIYNEIRQLESYYLVNHSFNGLFSLKTHILQK